METIKMQIKKPNDAFQKKHLTEIANVRVTRGKLLLNYHKYTDKQQASDN